jgi:hypothetical protein
MIIGVILTRLAANVAAYCRDRSAPIGPMRNAPDFRFGSQGNKTLVDRVQITRLDESIPRWQIRDLRVSTSQLRYALRASEKQIQEALELKPGQRMLIDLYPGGV